MYANSLDVPAKRGNQKYHSRWLFSIIVSSAPMLENQWCTSSQISWAAICMARNCVFVQFLLSKLTQNLAKNCHRRQPVSVGAASLKQKLWRQFCRINCSVAPARKLYADVLIRDIGGGQQ